ncbi:MAG: EAL domain-containing protein [Treponemataceae bacterium]
MATPDPSAQSKSISQNPFEAWRSRLGSSVLSAYFQPIVATDTGLVFGHEALGRFGSPDEAAEGKLKSLGGLFLAEAPRDLSREERTRIAELKRDVDRSIRKDAISKAFASGGDGKLFINIAPSLIMGHLAHNGGGIPHTINLVREYGIDPERIVLEITEEHMETDPEDLLKVIDQYRAEGFSIALDDVGSASSNLDRVGLFRPDIIKIDFKLLKRSSVSEAFKHILDALARLSERIGADLLFEGIEQDEELFNALSYGARYLQGFLFSEARPNFAAPASFLPHLERHLEYCFHRRYEDSRRRVDCENKLLEIAQSLGLRTESTETDIRSLVADDPRKLDDLIRIYATDLTGKQTTPNMYPSSVGLRTDASALGRRWSYRPYFFDHIEHSLSQPGRWTVSAPYRDIELGIPVRTLAKTDGASILFLDFPVKEKID